MKKLLVKKPPAFPNLLKGNVRSTKGKQEIELPLKPKSNAEDLKLNLSHQAISTELNPKTTQSGGTKETASGLESELEQEQLPGKTMKFSVLTLKTLQFGSGSSAIPTNGSILVIVLETSWLRTANLFAETTSLVPSGDGQGTIKTGSRSKAMRHNHSMVGSVVHVLAMLFLNMKTDAWQDLDQAELSTTSTEMLITISSTIDASAMHCLTGSGHAPRPQQVLYSQQEGLHSYRLLT